MRIEEGAHAVFWRADTGIDFTPGQPVSTGEFPGPASFVMRRSGGPVDFWDIHKV